MISWISGISGIYSPEEIAAARKRVRAEIDAEYRRELDELLETVTGDRPTVPCQQPDGCEQ